jgi:hypothetical protein
LCLDQLFELATLAGFFCLFPLPVFIFGLFLFFRTII